MMSKTTLSVAVLVAGLTVAVANAYAFKGSNLAGEAKVTLSQAKAIALKARPGTIADEELEREPGGSGLRYSFDVREGRTTYEVGVDAKTGKVLEVSTDGPHPD